MRTTYIINSNHISTFQKSLLQQDNVLPGVLVIPFNGVVYNESDHFHLNTYQQLKDYSYEFINLTPDLYFELFTFKKELYQYGIEIDSLPENDSFRIEIKQILKNLPLPTQSLPEDIIYVKDGLSHSQLHFLTNKNFQIQDFPITQPDKIQYKRALNFRQEIEGIVQDIVKKELETAYIAVPNVEVAWPYIKAAFDRYNIPYKATEQNSLAIHQFNSFIDYLKDANSITALELIESGIFKLSKEQSLLNYIRHYNLNYEDLFKPFDYAIENSHLKDIQSLIKTQEEIQDDVKILQTYLNKIKKQNITENILLGLELTQDQSIISYIQNIYSLINKENLDFIQYNISLLDKNIKIEGPIQPISYDALPLQIVDYLYVAGLTAKNFPNLSKNNGLLDESYRNEIPNYPSLQTRNTFQLNHLKSIFKKSRNLILSYHVSTYEGKPQLPAFEVERFCHKHNIKVKAWNIIEANPFMDERNRLDPTIAKRFYLKNGKLNASVSSLEKYIKDPFLYFKEEGLNLKEPFDFKLDARLLGTINHYAFEQYFQGNNDPFQLWDVYEPYLPKNNPYIKFLITINNQNTLENIHFLEKALCQTTFKPFKTEEYIKNENIFKDVSLRGFVDRIDISDNHFMIIDYKSSEHSISESKVLHGESLQLPTYAIAIHEKYGLQPFGIYYYSFNKKTTSQKPYKFLRSGIKKPDQVSIEDYEAEFKLSGWTFEDADAFGVSNEYFKGINANGSVRGGAYVFETVQYKLTQIINEIKENIINGVLDSNEIQLNQEPKLDLKKEIDTDEFEI